MCGSYTRGGSRKAPGSARPCSKSLPADRDHCTLQEEFEDYNDADGNVPFSPLSWLACLHGMVFLRLRVYRVQGL